MPPMTKHKRNAAKRCRLYDDVSAGVSAGVKAGIGFLSARVRSPRMTTGQTTGSTTPSSSLRQQNRRREKPCSDGDREMSPLEQAKEIQNEGYGSGNSNSRTDRDHRRRENHKRPPPVSRPFFSSPPSELSEQSNQNRGTNNRHRSRNHTRNNIGGTTSKNRKKSSQTVDLCSSNSDTDYDSDNKTRSNESPSSLSPKAQKMETRSGGSKPESAGKKRRKAIEKEKKRRQPSNVPNYPSVHLSDQNDDGNDFVISENDTSSLVVNLEEKKEENGNGDGDGHGHGGKNRKSKKKREESQVESEANAGSSFDESEERNSKSKQETIGFETNSGSCIDKIEERIPRKKPPPTQSSSDCNAMKVPALKAIYTKRGRMPNGSREKKQRKRLRHYDDIKDMDYSFEKDNDNDYAEAATPYLADMKNIIEGAESCTNGIDVDIDNDKVRNVISTSTTTTNYSANSNFMKNIKKVNNKGSRAKTKGKKASKIVPGASLIQRNNQQQQNEEQSHWRSEKDQDEYHTSNKETQDEDALRWDPVNGGSYRNTRSSTTRHSNQYGSSKGLSEHGTDSSPRRRSRRKNKQKTPETINILSSDSEDDDVVVAEEEECNVFKWPLKRLAVGDKRVYNNQDHQPMVIYNDEKSTMEITYFKSKVVQNVREKINIDIADVEEIGKWAADNAVMGLDAELDSFIFVRADVSMEFKKRRKEIVKKSQKLVLEFEEDLHMNDLDANLSDCASNKLYAVSPNDVEVIAASLISDSKKKYNLRSRVMPHETDAFISNRRSDEILVVYPFGVDKNKTEAAADGLKELSWSEKFKGENQDSVEPKNDNKMDSATSTSSNESSENLLTTVQSGQRSHFIEIRVEDYEKLATGQWLNDSLVDMWMQWTSRHIACKRSSNFHFFTSHFYTTLASAGGVTGVRSWTAKKNINIFEKRLIFIPINKTLHWSLCVVVNPGAIISSVDDDDNNDWKDRLLPCMLFFDSLNMHRKARVHSDVTKWLNSEWKRMKGSDHGPFNKHSCKIYDPQVPRQNNGSDCGVFVCRYAFAMFQLRHLKFSRRDAGLEKMDNERKTSRRQRNAPRSQAFSDLITNGKEFDFNVEDIQRIRNEFKTLIRNLHPMYKVVKVDKIKAEKEEKKARKRRKEKATETTQDATQKFTELIQCDLVETSSATATSNLNGAHGAAANDSSDSSKENRIPREDEEKPAQKMQKSNNEERQVAYGPLTSEATQRQSSLGTPVTGDPLGKNPRDDDMILDDTGDNVTYMEEMANNENMVHL